MIYNAVLVFLLMTSSLQYVISFAVHRRPTRDSGLAEALRMLERQRRRISNEENFLSPALVNDDSTESIDQESFKTSPSSTTRHEINPLWLAETLGVDSSNLIEDTPEDIQIGEFLDESVEPSSTELEPLDDELESDYEEDSDNDELLAPPQIDKKDKEVMTNVVGDARPKIQTRSHVMDKDDVGSARKEFKALLRAVEKIQEEAVEKEREEEEEAEEVMEEVKEKIAEAREEAKEEAAEREVEAALEDSASFLGDEKDADGLFEEQSEEMIPTENGEILRTDTTWRNPAGEPVGKEEAEEQLQTFPGDSSQPSIQDLWYIKKYIDAENKRRKRNSKRSSVSLLRELPPQNLLTSELIQSFVKKISDLETDLDQANVQTYLEDVENDLLTQALNQATLSQIHPDRLPLKELSALRDAIRVEEMLQEVKADRTLASGLAQLLDVDEESEDLGNVEKKKRGEPWRKRADVMLPEVPVYVMDEKDNVIDDVGSDSGNIPTALAIRDQLDEDDDENAEDPFVPFSEDDVDQEVDSEDDDLIPSSFDPPTEIASLFSDDADQCPAVIAFSSNCQFAGHTIDYEARALCNLHEMCYACGNTLEMKKEQCDFIYRAASSMLCEGDQACTLDSELFLNTMKLKHRFVPYIQPLCRAQCAARFLSIV